jgi:poly(A) polymerase
MADQIGVVSAERIAAELERMLVHGNRRLAVELLRDTGLLAATLPEVGQPPDRVLRVLAALERPSFSLGLAALFRLAADTPDEAAALCESASGRLKLSNDITDLAVWLVRNQCALRGARSAAWAKMQRLLIRPEIQELVALEAAVLAVEGLPGEDLEFVREKLALAPEVLNPPPLLTGDDLIRHGVPRGPLYKTLLDRVRDEQLEGRIVSQQEALELVDRLREG